jgi:predicted MFS family arabinose efflux permease
MPEQTTRYQTEPTTRTPLPRRLVAVMALACGVAVANVYFPQAVIPLLARDLHVSAAAASLVATLAQLGYAAGIFLLVPLGDRLPRRPLIVVLLGVVAAGLVLAGISSTLPALYGCYAVVGVATVVPQILIPMAADLSDERHRAGTVGVLQGGLLAGILLARTFSGTLGQLLGWRAPFLIAGTLAVLLAATLAIVLPARAPDPATNDSRHHYPALLGTSLQLLRSQPDLRRSCFYQFLLFGAFSATWTSIALYLTGPAYHYGTGVVGLVALVGAASVLAVPVTGRKIDRYGPDTISILCFAGMVLAAATLLTGLAHGLVGLSGLIFGMLLLDLAVQSSQVANQARIFALLPGARSRLNSAYMTAVFLGGSTGSWLGARTYLTYGWPALCTLPALAGITALLRHALRRPR